MGGLLGQRFDQSFGVGRGSGCKNGLDPVGGRIADAQPQLGPAPEHVFEGSGVLTLAQVLDLPLPDPVAEVRAAVFGDVIGKGAVVAQQPPADPWFQIRVGAAE